MKQVLILFIVLMSVGINVQSQNVDYQKLNAYFEKAAKDWGIPGMSG